MTSVAGTPQKSLRDQLPDEARYECLVKIASGGMATVYVGRLRGLHGFSRLVAVKRAHAHLVDDPELRRALIAEAKLASRLHHPNVCGVLDIDEPRDELLLVMDYVEGASLAQLGSIAQKRGILLPPAAAVRIVLDLCAGLHVAHELRGDDGEPLHIVHRDVSPQNVLVGVDGLSRIADFGVAKWSEATHATTTAGVKGKFAYMAPEYIQHRQVDRRVDVFAIGVTLWEALTGRRLFRGDSEMETMMLVVTTAPQAPSEVEPRATQAFDEVIAKALDKDPAQRYATASELGAAIESAARQAGIEPSHDAVATTVRDLYGDVLDARKQVLRDLLKASGETTSAAGAMVGSGVVEEARTATAIGGTVTLSDAKTLAREAPPIASVAEPPVPPPVPPRSGRLLAGAIAAVVTVLVVLVGLTMRGKTDAAPGAPSPSAPSSLQARVEPGQPPGALASSSPSGDEPVPSVQASASTAASSAAEPTPTAKTAPRPPAPPVVVAKPAPTVEPARPARPGLGY